MPRWPHPLLLLLAPICAADAQQPDPAIAPRPVPPEASVALGLLDHRMTIAVGVGAHGPFDFLIDTGAERSVVSRELAVQLGLARGRPITLVSMTDRRQVDTVVVPDLMIPAIGERHTVEAPALDQRNLGAAGMLGLDALRDRRVTIDFDAGRMELSRVERRRAPARADEIVVSAKSLSGQLIVTQAYFGDVPIRVVIDTGSQVSVGNSALRRRVVERRIALRPIDVTSVTGRTIQAEYCAVPSVRIGAARFPELPVAFADVEPFARLGLTRRPALLLGMDALRAFRRVEIDFANRQVRLRLPRNAML